MKRIEWGPHLIWSLVLCIGVLIAAAPIPAADQMIVYRYNQAGDACITEGGGFNILCDLCSPEMDTNHFELRHGESVTIESVFTSCPQAHAYDESLFFGYTDKRNWSRQWTGKDKMEITVEDVTNPDVVSSGEGSVSTRVYGGSFALTVTNNGGKKTIRLRMSTQPLFED